MELLEATSRANTKTIAYLTISFRLQDIKPLGQPP
jgi:hypothetical protein